MKILYGGAFNPPTIAHVKIIKLLLNKYRDAKIIIIPSNNDYKSISNIDFIHRMNMIEIIKNHINSDRLIISDFELTLDKYYGTYYTLKHFNHPSFVIGSDQLNKIDTWIKYPEVVKENKFIVIPRVGYNMNEILNSKLKGYKDNFTIIDEFDLMDISSTEFRRDKEQDLVLKEVYKYIKDNNLYEVK